MLTTNRVFSENDVILLCSNELRDAGESGVEEVTVLESLPLVRVRLVVLLKPADSVHTHQSMVVVGFTAFAVDCAYMRLIIRFNNPLT